MKVLLISKACIVGTYQVKLEEIARHQGVELLVVVPPEWRERGTVTRLERAHLRGYRLLVAQMYLNGHFHLHWYPALVGIVRRFRPDVVHVDEEPYNVATLHAAALAARYGARRLFFTWQNLLRRYPPPFSLVERANFALADWAIAGSQGAVAVLRAKGFRRPVSVVPQFGVDPAIFTPRVRPTPRDIPVVAFLGRLVEEKGVQVLLRAFHGLAAPARLLIVGAGPYEEQLRALAAQLGVPAEFRPAVPSTRMPALLAEVDVVALPSLTRRNWKEQFGRVLVEAMASGIPVVGSSCGEIPNVIGDAGLVVPEGDPAALAAALERLVTDPCLRARLAARGRERVLCHFTQRQVAEETVAIYSRLA